MDNVRLFACCDTLQVAAVVSFRDSTASLEPNSKVFAESQNQRRRIEVIEKIVGWSVELCVPLLSEHTIPEDAKFRTLVFALHVIVVCRRVADLLE